MAVKLETNSPERVRNKRTILQVNDNNAKKQSGMSEETFQTISDTESTNSSLLYMNDSIDSPTTPQSPSDLRKIAKTSSPRPKKWFCDHEGCDKAYSRPSLLEQHLQTHYDIRSFECDECLKSFFRKSHLNAHKISHQTEKPFKCLICSKGVNTKQHLRRHEKTHEQAFACDECDLKFYKKIQLKNHKMRVHDPDRLKCTQCNKLFLRPYRLANHMEKVHGKEPQYQCTNGNCMKSFKTWSALQSHITTDHPRVKCGICGKACVGILGLRMHMVIHDDDQTVRIWKCLICKGNNSVAFQKKNSLMEHYDSVHS